jgi:DNA-binding XRE family transcriptional regulator
MTAKQLKKLRAALGLTQTQLGELVGVTKNSVNRWEMALHPVPKWAELSIQRLLEGDAKAKKLIELSGHRGHPPATTIVTFGPKGPITRRPKRR